MKITPRTEDEAQKVSKRKLLKPGTYDAKFVEAAEKASSKGSDIIELVVAVTDPDGNERTFKDYLNNSPLGAIRLRHVCIAAGVLDKYQAGEIVASDFPGKPVRVRVGVKKQKGYPDRNVIEDYVG